MSSDLFTSIERGEIAWSAFVVLTGLIILLRLFGLRSLAKMSWIDFASTVALGSIIASTILWATWALEWVIAMGMILLYQSIFIRLWRRSKRFDSATENSPVLLMRNWVFVESALTATNISKESVYAKLREANVLTLSNVQAVVFETAWDISVLHWSHSPDSELMSSVEWW